MYPCGSSSSPQTNIPSLVSPENPTPLVLPPFKAAFLSSSDVFPRCNPCPLPPLLEPQRWALGKRTDLTAVPLLENRTEREPIEVVNLLDNFPDLPSSSSIEEPENGTIINSLENSRNNSTQKFLEKLFEKTPLENPFFTTLLAQDLSDDPFEDIQTEIHPPSSLISSQEEENPESAAALPRIEKLLDECTNGLCNFDDAHWTSHLFASIDELENEIVKKFGKSNRFHKEARANWQQFYEARNHAIVMFLEFSLQKNPQLKIKDFAPQLQQVYKKNLTEETLLHIRRKLGKNRVRKISYTPGIHQAVVWHYILENKTPYQYCERHPLIKVTSLNRWLRKHRSQVNRIIAEQKLEKIAQFKNCLQKKPFRLVFPEVPVSQ